MEAHRNSIHNTLYIILPIDHIFCIFFWFVTSFCFKNQELHYLKTFLIKFQHFYSICHTCNYNFFYHWNEQFQLFISCNYNSNCFIYTSLVVKLFLIPSAPLVSTLTSVILIFLQLFKSSFCHICMCNNSLDK